MTAGPSETSPADASSTPVARRAFLRALGLGGVGVAAAGSGLLAACGDGGDRKAASPTTTTLRRTPAPSVAPYNPKVPYWEQGNFAPVTKEVTVTDLPITGAIPSELSGLFVRNGSNPPTGKSLHWFLGDGMVHGVRLEQGKATWYRNRYVSTPLHHEGKDIMSAGGPPGEADNQSNVALVHHGGKLLTTGEVGWPYEIRADDLSTVGPWDFHGRLGPTMTAHPKIDPATGKMHFFGYEFLRPAVTYYIAEPDGTISHKSAVPTDTVTMIHDFAITDQDAVFWIGPVVFGADAKNPNPSIPFHWDPKGPCKVGVMPLHGPGSAIRWVDVPLGYAFHGLNAHRDGDDVVVNLHRQPSAFGPQGDLLPSHLYEWRINTAGRDLTMTQRRVSDISMDLPTHDRRHTGRSTRHGWFATVSPVTAPYGFELAGICHLDLQTGAEDRWEPGLMERAGEAFFVPAGKAEGEGWLLTFLYDRTTDRSSLGIFDAQHVGKGPVARVHLPVRVPFGFHGLWVDDTAA
ncbi:MAG TPA: carotenoid oxygenase family protein [Acidimicrobiales bacterium]|jgi:carotenoid cleavage dioxygenase